MIQRLPRALIVGLSLLAVTSFVLSVYLEQNHLEFLQRHPIMVNLMSGVVGFSSGVLAVAIGFNWFTRREHTAKALPAAQLLIRNVSWRLGDLIGPACEFAFGDGYTRTLSEYKHRSHERDMERIRSKAPADSVVRPEGVKTLEFFMDGLQRLLDNEMRELVDLLAVADDHEVRMRDRQLRRQIQEYSKDPSTMTGDQVRKNLYSLILSTSVLLDQIRLTSVGRRLTWPSRI